MGVFGEATRKTNIMTLAQESCQLVVQNYLKINFKNAFFIKFVEKKQKKNSTASVANKL